MTFERDSLGIPVLNAEDIERLSERFLTYLAPHVLWGPSFTPIVQVMTRLREEGHCTFSFNEELGTTNEGYKYLGYYDLRRKHIAIDVSLSDEDVRFPFTAAHELGHFYLHAKIKPEALGLRGRATRFATRPATW